MVWSSALSEQFVLLSLGLAVIGIRIFERWRQVGGPREWSFDDYMMPLVGIIFTLETVAAFQVVNLCDGLTNSYMTPAEREQIQTGSDEFEKRVLGSKIQIFGWSCYAAILWGLKFCLAAYYSRLTARLTHLRIRILIAYALLTVTYLATALTLLLSCQPFHKFWQINPDPGDVCQPTRSQVYVFICFIPNVVTDIYLSTIPLPLVWGANIGFKRKMSLIPLFGGAVFIMMACTIRAVTILTSGPDGAATGSQWACRETFVAIVVTNLLIIYPLIRKGAKKIGLSALFSTAHNTTRYGDRGYPLGSSGGGARQKSGSRLGMGSSHMGGTGTGAGGGSSSKPSMKPWKSGGGGGGSHALSTMTRVTVQARDSDEDIILGGSQGGGKNSPPGQGLHNIMVSREFTVETEPSDGGSSRKGGGDDSFREHSRL